MKQASESGFAPLLLMILIIAVAAVGFSGWYVLKNDSSGGTTSSVVAGNSKLVTLTLTEKATSKPLANTYVKLLSNNGINCPQSVDAPCPNNYKQWQGNTDSHGVIKVKAGFIQKYNEIHRKKTFSTGTVGFEPIAHFDESGVSGSPGDPVNVTLDR